MLRAAEVVFPCQGRYYAGGAIAAGGQERSCLGNVLKKLVRDLAMHMTDDLRRSVWFHYD